jgi:hypothetical protein
MEEAMKTKWTRAKAVLMAAAALVLSVGLPVTAADNDRSDSGLEGTWRVEVTTRNCTNGAPLLTFRAYLTFARGGTMTGTTASPAFKAGQRTSDHGVWRRTAGQLYETASEAFILFDSPASPPAPALTRGWQWIGQQIAIDAHDPDVLHSDATTEFYDMAGNELSSGCATAVGHRFE